MSFPATARALLGATAFLITAPGIVAGVVPWWLTGWEARDPLPFWIVARVAGVALLVPAVVA